MIHDVSQAASLPTLERMLQFSAERHRLIAHNIANLSTPGFRPSDVDPEEFQAALREAVERRSEAKRSPGGAPLELEDTRNISFHRDGMRFDPQPLGDNVLFHDDNDRNLERIMQDLVENFMVFRIASDLVRSRFDLINQAIAERV